MSRMEEELDFLVGYDVPKKTPEEIFFEVNPTEQDTFLAVVSRGYNEKTVGEFFKSFPSIEALKNFASQILTIAPTTGDITYDYGKVATLKKLDSAVVDHNYTRMNKVNVMATPFNIGNAVAESAYLKCIGVSGNKLLYDTRTGVPRSVTLDNHTEWFNACVGLLKDTAAHEKQRTYHFYPMDSGWESLSMAVSARYEIKLDGLIAKFVARGGTCAPPSEINGTWTRIGKMTTDAVEETIASLVGKYCDSYDETNQLVMIYSLMAKYETKIPAKYSQAIKWYETTGYSDLNIVLGIDHGALKEHVEDYKRTGEDRFLHEAKLSLNDVRKWRLNMKTLDQLTHDICVPQDLQHIPENKWGPTHRSALLCGIWDAYSLKDMNNTVELHLIGAGSDLVARVLEQAYFIDKKFGSADAPIWKDIYQPGVPQISGNVRQHSLKDLKKDISLAFKPGKSVVPIVMINSYDEIASVEDREEVSTASEVASKIPAGFEGIAIFSMTACHVSRLFGLVKKLRGLGMEIFLHRHQRRHNDHYYIIGSKRKSSEMPSSDEDIFKFHYGVCNEMMYNNRIRNAAIWTGFRPRRSGNVSKYLMSALGYAMAVKDIGRNISSKKLKIDKEGTDYLAKKLSAEVVEKMLVEEIGESDSRKKRFRESSQVGETGGGKETTE